MNIKEKFKQDPFSLLLVVSVLLVTGLTFTNFENWEEIKGLLYPVTTTNQISGSKANRLEVWVFEHDHRINKKYELNEGGTVSVIEPSKFSGSISSGEVIESDEDIKNIILEASPEKFVGWSGCDAETNNKCLVSATNHQKRKVEAHYSNPEPKTNSLQLFSVSNNRIGGSLTDDWTNANPDLAYKAAYIDLTGSIPDTIEELDPSLQLNLGGNDLEGEIPEEVGKLSNTDYIGLYKNDLTGSIPKELGNLNPKYFLAYNNELEGSIPKELGNMDSAKRFELHNNKLEGAVPEELTKLSNLNPKELRLFNNNLDSTESGLMQGSWDDGINFHNNNFSKGAILDSLGEAASSSGDYIDFCGNAPVVHATYSADGKNCNLDVPDEVNAAADAWGEIYVEATLEQDIKYYPGTCSGECKGSIKTKTVTDEDGNETEKEYCSVSDSCDPDVNTGSVSPPPGGYPAQYCIKITETVTDCDELDPIPNEVNHVAEFKDCDIWTHPECEPICESSGCSGSTSNCPNASNYVCEATGDFKSGWDPFTNDEDGYIESCK